MLLDTLSLFSDGQALSGTSVAGTKTLDIGKAGVATRPLYLVVRTEGASGLTGVTLNGSDTASGAKRVVAQAAVTDATAGVTLALPEGCPQFLSVTFAGSSMAGKVTAGLTPAADSLKGHRIGDYAAQA